MDSSDAIDPRGGVSNEVTDRTAQHPLGTTFSGEQAPRRVTWIVLLAAVLAGVVAWLVGETDLVEVKPKQFLMNVMGAMTTSSTGESEMAAKVASAARVYGVLGAALGLSLGIAGYLSRRKPVKAWVPALLGAGLGALAGYATSYAGVPMFERSRLTHPVELMPSMLLHGSIWGAIGAACGLTFGVGAGVRPILLVRCLLGGLVGALVGTTLFETLGVVFFSSDQTGDPVSLSSGSRLLGRLLICVFSAAGVLVGIRERPRVESAKLSIG